jgi:hypothetical protein
MKDKPPIRTEYVRIRVLDPQINEYKVHKAIKRSESGKYAWFSDEGFRWDLDAVHHWMPIPEGE